MKKLQVSAAMLWFSLLLTYRVQAQLPSTAAIDSLVNRAMSTFQVPGMALTILKDGKVVHSKGYGVRSLNTMAPVDEHTLFGIASNSKVFTAVALGMLVDEKRLNWDDPVQNYIPEFELYDPYVSKTFTVRDLLTHRCGLGLGAGDLMIFPDSNTFDVEDIIHGMQALKPVSSFRSKFDYNNNLFVVAGEVLKRITGKTWASFVTERIFLPLGMNATAASMATVKDRFNLAEPHAVIDGKLRVIDRTAMLNALPAGGIVSNLSDMQRWVDCLMNEGAYGSDKQNRLISSKVYDEITSMQTIMPVRKKNVFRTHFSGYGLGLFVSDVMGYKQLSHGGGLNGMVTNVTMIPEQGLAFILLTNQQEGMAMSAVLNTLKEAYFGLNPGDHVTEYGVSRQKMLADDKHLVDSIAATISTFQKTAEAKEKTQLVGSYKDEWLGEVAITEKKGKLFFGSTRQLKLHGEMQPFSADCWVIRWKERSLCADAFLNVIKDEKGSITGFKMKPVSPLTDFSYDFQDLNFRRNITGQK